MPPANCVSESTILRSLHRFGLSKKVKETRNIACDDAAGYEYMVRIAHLDPMNCIDIDETACNRDAFIEKRGWSPIGEPCTYCQIVILNKCYSVVSAISPLGFLCWEIFEGPVCHEEFINFIEQRVQPLITANTFLVIDNASIHKHVDSRACLQRVFNGAYYFCAPYSPHLKPTETCYAMIKSHIRANELNAQMHPIQFLHLISDK